MSKYAQVAMRAMKLVRGRLAASPQDAWRAAAVELFPSSEDSQKKSCPKGAYLGLCEDGLVVGIPKGRYSAGAANKKYAVDAVQLLRREPALAEAGPAVLWERVMDGRSKKPNHQMEVVLSLWSANFIRCDQLP